MKTVYTSKSTIFRIIILFLIVNLQAFAWFPVQANCQYNAAEAKCVVYNNSMTPLFCKIKVFGATNSGFKAQGSNSGWVQPGGGYLYGYVSSNNPRYDPLIRANANAKCRY